MHDSEAVDRRTALQRVALGAGVIVRAPALDGCDFKDARADQQDALLVARSAGASDPVGVEFFEQIKTYTIDGCDTSGIGRRRELGDTGNAHLAHFPGCSHPEHQR